MIIDLLLAFVTWAGTWLFQLLPQFSLSIPQSVEWFIKMCLSFDDLMPMSELLSCMASYVMLVAGMWAVKIGKVIIDWIMDVIP